MLPTKFQFIWLSQEQIKMWKVNGRQTTDKTHFAFGKVN
jgi:hypothetical protein